MAAGNKNINLIREQLKAAHQLIEGTVGKATTDQVHWSPPGKAIPLGLGDSTVGYIINNGILGHAYTHCGEISCLKGLQGERGYPM